MSELTPESLLTPEHYRNLPEEHIERIKEEILGLVAKPRETRELPLKTTWGAGTSLERTLPKECCPICGHTFDEVREINVCPTMHYAENVFEPEDLITEDDDYAWCL